MEHEFECQNRSASMANELADLLQQRNLKIVLAESCTAGMVAATLARVAGISQHFCGSAVTYREQTKQNWLNIDGQTISQHTPESAAVSRAMAIQVLAKTPEADWSAAITGHLGPEAPPNKDGQVDLVIAKRTNNGEIEVVVCETVTLKSAVRTQRQLEAACLVLQHLSSAIDRDYKSL